MRLPVKISRTVKQLFSKNVSSARGPSLDGQDDSELAHVGRLINDGNWADAFARLNDIKARARPPSVDYLRALCFLERDEKSAAVEALKEELRYNPSHKSAFALLQKLHPPLNTKLGGAEFRELFAAIQPYTMVGEKRIYSLYKLARQACELDIPGNFVECGVAAGGSSALLAAVIQRHSKRSRMLYAFDTFEGMPETTPRDVHEGIDAAATGWGKGTCAAEVTSLQTICRKLGVGDLVQPVKGLFADTLPSFKRQIGSIALLHMDGDWYSSTCDILEHLFDLVEPMGPVQIDDYGFWRGCREAVDEFAARRGLAFRLERIDETGVWTTR